MRALHLLLALSFTSVACSRSTADEKPSTVEKAERPKTMTANVALRISPPPEGGPHSILATTNLPDGTELLFTVSSKTSPGDGYQSKAEVANRQARGGPFGRAGYLPAGEYEVTVTMPLTRLQPEKVQQVIGANGEHLKGPLVERGEMGTTVHQALTFKVGGEDAPTLDEAIAEAKAVHEHLVALEEAGRAMEPYRKSSGLQKCGELMRKNQARAEGLQTQAERLPLAFRIHLGAAAIHLSMCASCMADAGEFCDRAKTALAEGEAAIKDAK